MPYAVFNGIELVLIAVALMGAAAARYCALRWRAEKPTAPVRDRDPLDEAFRGEMAFLFSPMVYDQEGRR